MKICWRVVHLESIAMEMAVLTIFHCFSGKIRLDISYYESSARQRIHMKDQDLFSSKDSELQIRDGIEDNSKIIFFTSR